MASYGLDERFKTPKHCQRLTDPAAYDTREFCKLKQNKYGFLSNAPRVTKCWRTPYTDNIYDTQIEHTIPNVTSLKSKTPRFSYEAFKEEDLDQILCTCGIENTCECPTVVEVPCQAKVHKRLFKGPPPHSLFGEGLSVPTKRDRGFEILHDGTTRRLLDVVTDACPPFYDARVHHSPEFYQGCKWSQWKTPRTGKSLEVRPGPADYCIEKEKTQAELCAEHVRAYRRRNSKQLRFIELVQNRNIRENRPGPADYTPHSARRTDLKILGPLADRFLTFSCDIRPSPASYWVKRDFDLPERPKQKCHAKLPLRACFGNKAQRFKNRIQEGPSPADYNANIKLCRILNCSKAPFGCSAVRFQEKKEGYADNTDELLEEEEEKNEEVRSCPNLTWQFKSRTKRFRSNKTEFDPLIPYLTKVKAERSVRMQALAPFLTSQGRFQPWFDWLPLHTGVSTPGPGYYNLTKPRCLPAVKTGPLFRAQRLRDNTLLTPAPNEHRIGGGVDNVLFTCNVKLSNCVKQKREQLKLRWKPPQEIRHMSPQERELLILDKAIKQLETEEETSLVVLKDNIIEESPDSKRVSAEVRVKRASLTVKRTSRESKDILSRTQKKIYRSSQNTSSDTTALNEDKIETAKVPSKQKMLRTFLYSHPTPIYF